jgi:hypothetical protein
MFSVPTRASEKWNYVRDNPVRAGLVSLADDWPYAGENETPRRSHFFSEVKVFAFNA